MGTVCIVYCNCMEGVILLLKILYGRGGIILIWVCVVYCN